MVLKIGPDDGLEDARDRVRDAAAEQRGDDQRGLALGGAACVGEERVSFEDHAVAAAVGLEALIELARRGRVTFKGPGRRLRLLSNAGGPAKRKAALVVAALLGGCVPDSVPRVLRAVIGSYL